jgi:Fe2+ or Zn2+ uptake regulation protein
MTCPETYGFKKCYSNKFKELYHSKTDNIDGLDHSHMLCEECGAQFNYWNEPLERIKEAYGDSYKTYLN